VISFISKPPSVPVVAREWHGWCPNYDEARGAILAYRISSASGGEGVMSKITGSGKGAEKPKRIRPPGGRFFEAVQVAPEGWLCLAPWIQTPDGSWWRPHIAGCERLGEVARLWAEDVAYRINAAMCLAARVAP